MIKPRYMLCCEGQVVDRETGMVTHFNVVDQLTVTLLKAGGRAPFNLPRLFISATWTRDSQAEDPDEAFEHEMRMFVPGEDVPRVLHTGEFRFGRFRHFRSDVVLQTQPMGNLPNGIPANAISFKPGVLRFESRVHRKGDATWLSQECDISILFAADESLPASS